MHYSAVYSSKIGGGRRMNLKSFTEFIASAFGTIIRYAAVAVLAMVAVLVALLSLLWPVVCVVLGLWIYNCIFI